MTEGSADRTRGDETLRAEDQIQAGVDNAEEGRDVEMLQTRGRAWKCDFCARPAIRVRGESNEHLVCEVHDRRFERASAGSKGREDDAVLIEAVRARLAESGASRDFVEFATTLGMIISQEGGVSHAEVDGPHCWTLWEGLSVIGIYVGTPLGRAAADADCAALNAHDAVDRTLGSQESLYKVVRSELHVTRQFDRHGRRRLTEETDA